MSQEAHKSSAVFHKLGESWGVRTSSSIKWRASKAYEYLSITTANSFNSMSQALHAHNKHTYKSLRSYFEPAKQAKFCVLRAGLPACCFLHGDWKATTPHPYATEPFLHRRCCLRNTVLLCARLSHAPVLLPVALWSFRLRCISRC